MKVAHGTKSGKSFAFVLFDQKESLDEVLSEGEIHEVCGEMLECKKTLLRDKLKKIQMEQAKIRKMEKRTKKKKNKKKKKTKLAKPEQENKDEPKEQPKPQDKKKKLVYKKETEFTLNAIYPPTNILPPEPLLSHNQLLLPTSNQYYQQPLYQPQYPHPLLSNQPQAPSLLYNSQPPPMYYQNVYQPPPPPQSYLPVYNHPLNLHGLPPAHQIPYPSPQSALSNSAKDPSSHHSISLKEAELPKSKEKGVIQDSPDFLEKTTFSSDTTSYIGNQSAGDLDKPLSGFRIMRVITEETKSEKAAYEEKARYRGTHSFKSEYITNQRLEDRSRIEEERLKQIMDEDYHDEIASTKGLYHQEHDVERIEGYDENEFVKVGHNENLKVIPETKISQIDDFLSGFKVIDSAKPNPNGERLESNGSEERTSESDKSSKLKERIKLFGGWKKKEKGTSKTTWRLWKNTGKE